MLSDHFYLDDASIAWLTPDELLAVETGLREAISRNYGSASNQLAHLYELNGENRLAAQAYEHACLGDRDEGHKVADTLAAAHADASAGDLSRAEALYKDAIVIEPTDAKAYRQYIESVLVPLGRTDDAGKLIEDAAAEGVDTIPLDCAFAEAAESLGRHGEAADALRKAGNLAPSFEISFRLGQIYKEEKRYDRAALSMELATRERPTSAEAFYELGLAQQATYEFSAADRSFQKALKLQPQNNDYHEHYNEFRKQLASSEKAVQDGD
jgi:tetratricopeptide (TPR) repeat protein